MITINYLKFLAKSKRLYFIFLTLAFATLIIAVSNNNIYKDFKGIDDKFSFAYLNMFSIFTGTFLLIPLFLILPENNIQFFDNYKVLIRINERKRWWINKIIAFSVEVFLYVIITNILMFSYALYLTSDINYVKIFSVFLFAIPQFLGYMILGLIVFISSYIGRKVYGILLDIFIIGVDFGLAMRAIDFSLLVFQMYSANYGKFHIQYIITSTLYLSVILISLIIGGYLLLNDNDNKFCF